MRVVQAITSMRVKAPRVRLVCALTVSLTLVAMQIAPSPYPHTRATNARRTGPAETVLSPRVRDVVEVRQPPWDAGMFENDSAYGPLVPSHGPWMCSFPIRYVFVDGVTGQGLSSVTVPGQVQWQTDHTVAAMDDVVAAPCRIAIPSEHASLVRAPVGYAALEGVALQFDIVPASYAELGESVVPIWRELRGTLRIVDSTGAPVQGARIDHASLCGVQVTPASTTSDERGVLRVDGIPQIRGDMLSMYVSTRTLRGSAAVAIEDDYFEQSVQLVECDEVDAYVYLPAELDLKVFEERTPPDLSEALASEETTDSPIGVHVWRSDGRAARECLVAARRGGRESRTWYARTSVDGFALFKLQPATYQISVCEPGVVSNHVSIDVGRGDVGVVMLHEGQAEALRIVVRDSQKVPVVLAKVEVRRVGSGLRLTPIRAGVQLLDLRTDMSGAVDLWDLEAGQYRCDVTHLGQTHTVWFCPNELRGLLEIER